MHGPSDKTGTAPAASIKVGIDFLAKLFATSETAKFYIGSRPNDDSENIESPHEERFVPAPHNAGELPEWLQTWDRPGRAMFFCTGILRDTATKRQKRFIKESCFLHVDIDLNKIDLVGRIDELVNKLRGLRCPPSIIVLSGHGVHAYWLFKEPVGFAEQQRVEDALKLLADCLGGDREPTHVAAFLRLPGSHNTKDGGWTEVTVAENNGHQYELDDLEEWLSETSVVILRKTRERPRTVGETDFFEQYGTTHAYKPGVDVEARLNKMGYGYGGDASIHITQRDVTSSLLSKGVAIDEVVALVLEATKAASGEYRTTWNWEREGKAIREKLCLPWLKKHPPGEQQQTALAPVIVKPITIDWDAVEKIRTKNKNLAALPSDVDARVTLILSFEGKRIPDLNVDLARSGVVIDKPFVKWDDVAFTVAQILRADTRLTNEKIAAVLLCPLPCNRIIIEEKDTAGKRDMIARLLWRTVEQVAKKKRDDRAEQVKHQVKQAEDEAKRLAKLPRKGEPDWRERRENGSPIPSLHNARLGIVGLGVECSFDTFHNKLLFGFAGDVKHQMQSLIGDAVSDHGVMALRQIMSDRFGFDPLEKHIRDAVVSLAVANRFDPVCDLIDKAEADWDGVERLDKMAVTHFNCEDTPLNRAFVRLTMIAMVARARNPGCKFDTITVLESPEGQNKSTAWRILAGDENFSDEAIIGKGSREVQEQLAGVWVHENAELAGMRKADVEAVKAFASRTTDIARAAYGHFPIRQARHSIDVGTTNSDEYLQSQTGNRRFWPLKILQAIDLVLLRRDRLQLIGEAAKCQSAGESITLDEKMWADAGIEQEKRRTKDAWEDVLAVMPAEVEIEFTADQYGNNKKHKIIHVVDTYPGQQERVASVDVLTYVLGIPAAHQNFAHSNRLPNVMKQLGWQRAGGNKISINGVQVRGYFRTVEPVVRPVVAVDPTKLPRF